MTFTFNLRFFPLKWPSPLNTYVTYMMYNLYDMKDIIQQIGSVNFAGIFLFWCEVTLSWSSAPTLSQSGSPKQTLQYLSPKYVLDACVCV